MRGKMVEAKVQAYVLLTTERIGSCKPLPGEPMNSAYAAIVGLVPPVKAGVSTMRR
jgi:hypothetical protein